MLTRRRMLQASVCGLAGSFPSAMAQQPRRRKKNSSTKATGPSSTIVADRRVAEVLAPVRDEHHLPGLIGAILTGNRLAAVGSVGIRKIGSAEEFRVDDRIHLGSCTKAMTATMIGTLVDQGKLNWGTTIGQVLADHADRLHPQFRAATLAHLLTHRAGLPPNVPWWGLPGRTPTEQRLSILTSALEEPPLHPPGKTYAYSNVGYALAGLMAEVVAEQPWEELMRERLFEPLRMTAAGFGPPGTPDAVDQPWGHHSVDGRVEPIQQDNAPSMGPAGTVHCTIADWARFAALHMAAARGQSRILKAATFRALHTPPPGFEYGGGWIICQRTWAGGTAYTHSGSNTMWYATVWIAPALNLAFLAATNQGGKEAERAIDGAIVALIRAHDYLVRG